MLARSREVGQRLALPDALPIDEIETLSCALDEPASGQHFCDAPVAGVLLPQQIVLVDPGREAARADDLDSPWVLAHEYGAAVAVVPVAHCVQDRLAHRALVEGRHVPDEQALLEVLEVVAQVHSLPDLVEHRQEAEAELTAVRCRPRNLVRPVLEEDLRLAEMPTHGFARTKQDQRGEVQAAAHQQLGVRQQPLGRARHDLLVGRLALPEAAQQIDRHRVEIVETCARAELSREVWSRLPVDPAKLVVRHRNERVAGAHPERALVLACRARKSRRYPDQQHPLSIVEVLRHSDALSELFEQSRLGAAGFREGSRADDLAGTRVGDSEHYDATPFVGDGNAVLDEILEVKASGRGLELDTTPFRLGEQIDQIHRGLHHRPAPSRRAHHRCSLLG